MHLRGCMESQNMELALYGSPNECTGTDIVSPSISEVSTVVVSLKYITAEILLHRTFPALEYNFLKKQKAKLIKKKKQLMHV